MLIYPIYGGNGLKSPSVPKSFFLLIVLISRCQPKCRIGSDDSEKFVKRNPRHTKKATVAGSCIICLLRIIVGKPDKLCNRRVYLHFPFSIQLSPTVMSGHSREKMYTADGIEPLCSIVIRSVRCS